MMGGSRFSIPILSIPLARCIMERRPPTPICRCLVLCKKIFVDPERQDYVLVGPTHQLFSDCIPILQELAIFARWTNSHGA
jgi:hypothetical protein